jgi:hypothetical protein
MTMTLPTIAGMVSAPIKGVLGAAVGDVIDQQMLTDATWGAAAIAYTAGVIRVKSVVGKTAPPNVAAAVKAKLIFGTF